MEHILLRVVRELLARSAGLALQASVREWDLAIEKNGFRGELDERRGRGKIIHR